MPIADLLTALAAGPTRAYRATRQAINAATLPGITDAFGREHTGQGALLSSADFAEGVAAFRERRSARFTSRASDDRIASADAGFSVENPR